MTTPTCKHSASTSAVVPIGLTITRASVPSVAEQLAEDLFHCTRGDIYKYLPDSSAKTEFAKTIGNYIHVWLNQLGVDPRECKHCGRTQQDHEWLGGWCSPSNGKKFEAQP